MCHDDEGTHSEVNSKTLVLRVCQVFQKTFGGTHIIVTLKSEKMTFSYEKEIYKKHLSPTLDKKTHNLD